MELGHTVENCNNEVLCTICGEKGHVYRGCPLSFANKLALSQDWSTKKSAESNDNQSDSQVHTQTLFSQQNSEKSDRDGDNDNEIDMRTNTVQETDTSQASEKCFKCMQLGHTAKNCTNEVKCSKS